MYVYMYIHTYMHMNRNYLFIEISSFYLVQNWVEIVVFIVTVAINKMTEIYDKKLNYYNWVKSNNIIV